MAANRHRAHGEHLGVAGAGGGDDGVLKLGGFIAVARGAAVPLVEETLASGLPNAGRPDELWGKRRCREKKQTPMPPGRQMAVVLGLSLREMVG